jgi:hypothetical protein
MGWVKSIRVISELGLIFMPFMIGLEIDPCPPGDPVCPA